MGVGWGGGRQSSWASRVGEGSCLCPQDGSVAGVVSAQPATSSPHPCRSPEAPSTGSLSQRPRGVSAIVILTLQIRTLSLREVKPLPKVTQL